MNGKAWPRKIVHVARWPSLVQGVVFGALVTVLAVLVNGLLVALWPWPWAYPQTMNATSQPEVFVAQMAFGQVFIGYVAIFLASTLGLFALREFIESHRRPELSLAFHIGGEEISTVHEGEDRHYCFDLVVIDKSPTFARWYKLQFATPFLDGFPEDQRDLMAQSPSKESAKQAHPILVVSGQIDVNWRPFRRGNEQWFMFESQGTVAVFTEWPRILCQFRIPAGDIPHKAYCVSYSIATEHALGNGVLPLRLD